MDIYLDINDVVGARPVMPHRAGAASGSLPRGGPSSATKTTQKTLYDTRSDLHRTITSILTHGLDL